MSEREPRMSVVLPAVSGGTRLADCLAALEPQAEASDLEILVVSRLPVGEAEAIAERFPRARTIRGEGLTIPQMRARGIQAARAPIVAILGEHVRPGAGWAAAMLAGHVAAPGAAAVGGSVAEPERSAGAGFAAFLAEYAEHLSPMREGPVQSLSGVNVSYKRFAIDAHRDLFSAGVWETLVHEALLAGGLGFHCEKGAEVRVARAYEFPSFAAEKLRIARSYAGMRASKSGLPGRLRVAAGVVVLPEVVLLRIFWRVLSRRPIRGPFALLPALPFLLVYVGAWTLGELAGALLGEGRSTAGVA